MASPPLRLQSLAVGLHVLVDRAAPVLLCWPWPWVLGWVCITAMISAVLDLAPGSQLCLRLSLLPPLMAAGKEDPHAAGPISRGTTRLARGSLARPCVLSGRLG